MVGRKGGFAEKLLSMPDVAVETVTVSGVDVRSIDSLAKAFVRLPLAVLKARRIIRAFNADVVVGAAGYVCVPVVAAALTSGVPVVLLEQNALPGKAVRLFASRARVVAASFTETAALLPKAHVVYTGNPVRAQIREAGTRPPSDRCRHLFLMGGSQGARRLNRAVEKSIYLLLKKDRELTITHQCGDADAPYFRDLAASLPKVVADRYVVEPFFEDIDEQIVAADLVIMRAGGSSLAECTVLGRPMILVPYPHAGGHQLHNAQPYVDTGAAVLIPDEECTGDRLHKEIMTLVADPHRWRVMAQASKEAGEPDATTRVVDLIREVAHA